MNYTTFINALSKELDKELIKELKRQGDEQETCFNFNSAKIRQAFDRAATTTITREMDKLTKLGRPKGA